MLFIVRLEFAGGEPVRLVVLRDQFGRRTNKIPVRVQT